MKLFGTVSLTALALLTSPRWAQAQTAPAATVAAPTPAPPASAAPAAPAAPAPATPTPAPPGTTPAPAAAVPPTTPPTASPAPAVAPPAPAPAAPAPQRATLSPGHALVHVGVNYEGAWLETRKYVDAGEFARTCRTPCDTILEVQGLEARVVAPGMTPSNTFRFDGGMGTAGVRVDGGSATVRKTGITTLLIGIPVALAGMAMFGLGRTSDKPGLEVGGIAALAVGGLGITVSLPLLLLGTTRVESADGTRIAGPLTLSPARN